MEQYLQALREREDISEEILLELEERFKVAEEVIDVPVVPKPTEGGGKPPFINYKAGER